MLGRQRLFALLVVVRSEKTVGVGVRRSLGKHGSQQSERLLGPAAAEKQFGPPDPNGQAVLLTGARRLFLEVVPLDLSHHALRFLGVARPRQGQTQVVTSFLVRATPFSDHTSQEGNRLLRFVRLVVKNGAEEETGGELREAGE